MLSTKNTSSVVPFQKDAKTNYSRPQLIGLILGPTLFAIMYFLVPIQGMTLEAKAVLACTIWIACWWMTEAIPLAVTSLLPIILFPLTGGLDLDQTTASYGDDTIFLFLGGFLIALAMEKWNLHRRIALFIIQIVGTNVNQMVGGFMVATAFLSMWISNTATAMMMVPIGSAIIYKLNQSNQQMSKEDVSRLSKALMIAIAYSASIGGLATIIGTPPNAFFAAIVEEMFGVTISFATWMLFGVPISAILLILTMLYLTKIAFPIQNKSLISGKEVILEERKHLGSMKYEEKVVLLVFALTSIAWISRSFLLSQWIPTINDTIIAMIGAIILFIIPSKSQPGQAILNWDIAKSVPWGILLLFGGGLAIATGFKETGLTTWIGEQLSSIQAIPTWLLLTIIALIVIFLTEVTSNTATASMFLPIMASLAMSMHIHPYSLMVVACISASCAFMLPVATPPNAVVFSSNYLKIGDMARAGFALNLIGVLVIVVTTYFLLPILWGIDLLTYPF